MTLGFENKYLWSSVIPTEVNIISLAWHLKHFTIWHQSIFFQSSLSFIFSRDVRPQIIVQSPFLIKCTTTFCHTHLLVLRLFGSPTIFFLFFELESFHSPLLHLVPAILVSFLVFFVGRAPASRPLHFLFVLLATLCHRYRMGLFLHLL